MQDGLCSWPGPDPLTYFPREQQQVCECEFLRVRGHTCGSVSLYGVYLRTFSAS